MRRGFIAIRGCMGINRREGVGRLGMAVGPVGGMERRRRMVVGMDMIALVLG